MGAGEDPQKIGGKSPRTLNESGCCEKRSLRYQSISKQRCEGRLRKSRGQTQVWIWVIRRSLERLSRLGECTMFAS